MDRGVKLTLATAVLLAGASVAAMYRHRLPPRPVEPVVAAAPVLRQWTGPQIARPPQMEACPQRLIAEAPVASRPRATIGSPLEPAAPPPKLARVYPRQDEFSDPRESPPIDYGLLQGEDSRPAVRIHRIVDGDTLASLAQRYLGSADRQREIYEANRDLLSDPGVLPIGVELKIPPRGVPPATKREDASPAQPLVPVAGA
jgi:nucleoid-associated protein YgaU